MLNNNFSVRIYFAHHHFKSKQYQTLAPHLCFFFILLFCVLFFLTISTPLCPKQQQQQNNSENCDSNTVVEGWMKDVFPPMLQKVFLSKTTPAPFHSQMQFNYDTHFAVYILYLNTHWDYPPCGAMCVPTSCVLNIVTRSRSFVLII